ncbi:MAG: PPOX class F420-dependent oxidoreductase [Candidatus Eremiobacteraeota bacterium]|nr:PPOX class F420-dependent oxidoreductase [Candidatus Eremiobacteraeota bacterium]
MAKKLSKILKDKKFCLLTTFKRNGEEVSSPMWFCLDGEKVYMTTRGQSWKVKRLRRNPKVKIGWSNSSGRQHGKLFSAIATIVEDPEERETAIRQLNKKYGLKKKLIDFGLRFAKDQTEAILRVEYDDE